VSGGLKSPGRGVWVTLFCSMGGERMENPGLWDGGGGFGIRSSLVEVEVEVEVGQRKWH